MIPEKYNKKLKALKTYLKPEIDNLANQSKKWAVILKDSMKGLEETLDTSYAQNFLKEEIRMGFHSKEDIDKFKEILKEDGLF